MGCANIEMYVIITVKLTIMQDIRINLIPIYCDTIFFQ